MHPPSLRTAVRRIRTLTGPSDPASDHELLNRFRRTRDDQAFAALVARHGPVVLGVCRRILGDPHAAEDAFQATFFALARRAASVRNAASLGCWLHGVTVRVSMKLKAKLSRSPRAVETIEVVARANDDVLWRDVRRVLDEELSRLPDRLRLPVYLCYLEGKTRDEAAEALGWKLTTLRGRLEDGRLRLRSRLSRRGIELSAALLAVSAAADGLAVSESLLEITSRVAAGTATDVIRSLASGIGAASTFGKAKLTVGVLLLAVGLGTPTLVYRGQAGETPGPAPKHAEKPEEKAPPAPPKADEWGEAVEGVSARLRLPNLKPKAGEPLAFELDLKNEGTKTFNPLQIPFDCDVYVDDLRYEFLGELDYKAAAKELKPGGELVPFTAGKIDDQWKYTRRLPGAKADDEPKVEAVPFRLSPGKHKIRVSFPVADKKVRPVSNTVEIEVQSPLDDATRAMALGADRVWVVEAATREGAVRNPIEVLKGPPADAAYPAGTKKQWIVFLRADDGQPVPEVKVWDWATWSRPYTPELADAIRQAILPTAWGPEADGLQLGLRLRTNPVRAGEPVAAEVTIRNVGRQPREIRQHRYNIYDYWPATRFEVTAPDGTKWLLEKPEGKMTEADAPTLITLKPGETYTQSMRLSTWPAHRAAASDFERVEDLFARSGEFTITCVWDDQNREVKKSAPPVRSNAVKLSVTPDPKVLTWGEPDGGFATRLRLPKAKFRPGDHLAFELDLKNTGGQAREAAPVPPLCEIHLDGTVYVHADPISWPTSNVRLEPGEELVPFLKFELGGNWTVPSHTGRPGPLPMKAGKHKLRVAYPVADKVKPVSNETEFEVADDWGEPVGGVRARLRLGETKFRASQPFSFALDLKNTGEKTYEEAPVPQHCVVELDGAAYRYFGPIDVTSPLYRLTPGKEYAPFVSVAMDRLWQHEAILTVPFVLAPGKHTVRAGYPLPGRVTPISPAVEFEVVADEPAAADLSALVARADRIVIATVDWQAGQPRLKPKHTLKGQHNRWQPDVQPLTIPVGTIPLPTQASVADREWLLFLRTDEDGVDAPKLSPADTQRWFQPADDTAVQAVLAAIEPVKDAGAMKNGLTLALRPTQSKVRLGDEVRLEVVLTNATREKMRVLQQRYNVYDYWPFLTFTVTSPSGASMMLSKPSGEFKREDYVDDLELAAGGQYAHAVRLNRWPVQRRPIPQDDGLPKFSFGLRGKYKIEAHYNAPIDYKYTKPGVRYDDWPFWNGELTSNTVTVEVTGPFDEVRRVTGDDKEKRLYVVLTVPDVKPADLADVVARFAGHALIELDMPQVAPKSVVFFIRRGAGDDRGYISGFERDQLQAIRDAKPDAARKLAGEHAWTLGKLPTK